MEVSEINSRRFDAALELLREGNSFSFDGVSFWIAPEGTLSVSVDSSWHISNITEQNALRDLERAKDVFAYLVRESPAFAGITENRPRQFYLTFGSEKNGVEVARLVNGKLVWT